MSELQLVQLEISHHTLRLNERLEMDAKSPVSYESNSAESEASEARAMKLTPSQVEVMEYLDEEEGLSKRVNSQ